MFTGSATFYPMALGSQARADPSFADGLGGVTLPCYAEPFTSQAKRDESHFVAEGVKGYYICTGSNPNVTTDYLVNWNQRTLRVVSLPANQDGWNLWRTECVEVA